MADRTTSSIVIAADPADIMDVIADLESYPEWTGSVRQVEVLEIFEDGRPATARFILDAGAIKDEYTLTYDWADEVVTWSLVEGRILKAMDGEYALADTGGGLTEVAYTLAVDVTIPMIGLIKRKAEKVIIDTALKELKKRVEA